MTVSCQFRVLLAQVNVLRARQRRPPLSLRALAVESGVSLSVLASLHAGRSHRIDYSTVDRLLTYFNRYLPVTAADLLAWDPDAIAV